MERTPSTRIVPEHLVLQVALGDEEIRSREESTLLARIELATQSILERDSTSELAREPAVATAISNLVRALIALPKDGATYRPREYACLAAEAAVTLFERGIPVRVVRLLVNSAYGAVEDSPFGRYQS